MEWHHPFHGLAFGGETARAWRAVLVGVIVHDHRLGDGVDLIRRLRSVHHENRVWVISEFDWLFRGNAGAAGRDMREEEASYFLHARPAGLVVMRKRRPDDAAR